MFRFLMNKLKPLPIVDDTFGYLLPRRFARAYRIAQLLIYMHKGQARDKFPIVKLPVYGQVALFKKNDNVYLVFDAERDVVTTYHAGPRKEMQTGRVSYLRKIGQSGIGPKIVEENKKIGWYREEFVNADHDTPGELEQSDALRREVMSFIARVIGQFPIKTVPLHHYVTKTIAKLPANIGEQPSYAKKMKIVLSFVALLRNRLLGSEDQNIDLVFSHGDLHLRNVIRRDGELIGIDWEFMKWRSLLYDAYYFYNYVKLKPDASSLLQQLETSRELNLSPIKPDVYRWLFQLEWIVHWLCIVGERLEKLKPERVHHILDNLIERSTILLGDVGEK